MFDKFIANNVSIAAAIQQCENRFRRARLHVANAYWDDGADGVVARRDRPRLDRRQSRRVVRRRHRRLRGGGGGSGGGGVDLSDESSGGGGGEGGGSVCGVGRWGV